MQKDDWTPTLEQLQAEQKRLNHRKKYRRALAGTIGILVVVAALSVLVSTVFLPVFRITGSSMEPNLNDGDIIVAMKTDSFQRGQVCGFYYNNKLLLKRVIATAGMWVDIDEDGMCMWTAKSWTNHTSQTAAGELRIWNIPCRCRTVACSYWETTVPHRWTAEAPWWAL